jgi:TRAP-type mannitol/chloroaromatic compound transport system substrate-binding protein
MTERRRFVATASGVMATAATGAIVDIPYVIAQPKVQWRMSTTWTPALDHLQGAAQRLAKVVDETSGARFRIEVFPGGQIMPPFDCFEAASQGTIEAFMGSSYYWTKKEPASYYVKSGNALQQLKTEFKGGVEVLPLSVPVLRDLRKLAAEVVKEESEKSPMARKVHGSFTKFQALVGPWDHVGEGAYHLTRRRRSTSTP